MRHFRDVVWVLDGICLHHLGQRWEAVAMMDKGMSVGLTGGERAYIMRGV